MKPRPRVLVALGSLLALLALVTLEKPVMPAALVTPVVPVAVASSAVTERVNNTANVSTDEPAKEPVNLPDIARLRLRTLAVPVASVVASDLRDTYTQARGGGTRSHEALDIPARRGTPVLAVEGGRIAKLYLSQPGGLTIYHFDNDSEFAYYYAHLDGYAYGLVEGAQVRKGQVIGYVGSTGNAAPETPHLHFAIFRLGPERQWWRGTPLNPYRVWNVPR